MKGRVALLGAAMLVFSSAAALAADAADDPCDHDLSFCVYPLYEGKIRIDGAWQDGSFRYRFADTKGTREYWVGNEWRTADDTGDDEASDSATGGGK